MFQPLTQGSASLRPGLSNPALFGASVQANVASEQDMSAHESARGGERRDVKKRSGRQQDDQREPSRWLPRTHATSVPDVGDVREGRGKRAAGCRKEAQKTRRPRTESRPSPLDWFGAPCHGRPWFAMLPREQRRSGVARLALLAKRCRQPHSTTSCIASRGCAGIFGFRQQKGFHPRQGPQSPAAQFRRSRRPLGRLGLSCSTLARPSP